MVVIQCFQSCLECLACKAVAGHFHAADPEGICEKIHLCTPSVTVVDEAASPLSEEVGSAIECLACKAAANHFLRCERQEGLKCCSCLRR